jgi:plasmid stability protein
MGQILVRDLNDEVIERLKDRARNDGRSLQSEVKLILEQAAQADVKAARKLANDIRKRFKGRRLTDSADLIREDRDGRAR